MGLHIWLIGDNRVDFSDEHEFGRLCSDVNNYRRLILAGQDPANLLDGEYYRCRFEEDETFEQKFVKFNQVSRSSSFLDSQTIEPPQNS